MQARFAIVVFMPELPEVESQARDLRRLVLDRPIKDVWVGWKKTIARPSAPEFVRAIKNRQIKKISRRGKFILLELDNGLVLVSHFRMTGHFRLAPLEQSQSAKKWYALPADRFTRVAFKLNKNEVLHFSDIRKFGRLWLVPAAEVSKLEELRDLGPEPLDKKFNSKEFVACLRRYTGMIKPILLRQTCVAGIGNIYADESLFDAGIHPKTRVERLPDAELATLFKMVRANLAAAVKHKGSSVGEYLNMRGEKGRHGFYLRVYGQKGAPCKSRRTGQKCLGTVKRIVVGQRGTHICPVCQKVRR